MDLTSVSAVHPAGAAYAISEFIGHRLYRHLLTEAQRRLMVKGYISDRERQLYRLEYDMYEIDKLRQRKRNLEIHPDWHEGNEFIGLLARVIPSLSDRGKEKLRKTLIDGLQNNLLRATQHEFRTALRVSKAGYDVRFHDLEADEGMGKLFDILAVRGNDEFEVEAKSVDAAAMEAVTADDFDALGEQVKYHYKPSNRFEAAVALIDIVVDGAFSTSHPDLRHIVDACARSADNKSVETVGNNITVSYSGLSVYTNKQDFSDRARDENARFGFKVFVRHEPPRVFIRMKNTKAANLPLTIKRSIVRADKQFTHQRPAIICCHIEYISREEFEFFRVQHGRESLFQHVARMTFASRKRDYVSQLVLTGGSHYKVLTGKVRTQFQCQVYDSTFCKFTTKKDVRQNLCSITGSPPICAKEYVSPNFCLNEGGHRLKWLIELSEKELALGINP